MDNTNLSKNEETSNKQVADEWSKPEIKLIGVNSETLGVFSGGADSGMYSGGTSA